MEHISDTAPMLAGLNPEQLAAVTLGEQHALVLAGAGSGKTRVLTARIAWLLHTQRISPGGVLAVTFTNKAAREMLTRLGAMLPLNMRGMWVGTFHGLCNRFLRTHWRVANLPQGFQILDTADQLAAIRRVCKDFGVDSERYPPKQLQWFINGCKEEGLRPSDVAVRDPDGVKKVEIYQLYEQQCQREGVADFGELMLRCYEVLRDHEDLRAHYRRRFRYILVDEFQDTNRLQYEWLKIIAGLPGAGGGAIMAVGDDDQSIYAFRGARVGNMADFMREYHVAEPIRLEENYRSFSHILNAANALIAHNANRLGKNLRTARGVGEKLRVYEAADHMAEAEWVLQEIRHLKREGMARHEMAILYRSNAQSRVFETALYAAGIPYRVYGGLRFFERAEIKNALAWLRLLENPHDDTSFLRVVNFPPRGIGARTIEQLQAAAHAARCPLAAVCTSISGRSGARLTAFLAQLDVMREQARGKPLGEVIDMTLEASGMRAHYKGEKDGSERLENLDELLNAAESFAAQEGFYPDAPALGNAPLPPLLPRAAGAAAAPSLLDALLPGVPQPDAGIEAAEVLEGGGTLAAFLAHAALEAGEQAQAGQDAVQLMSVHASKGLEFDAVFITGLEEGLFPHENSMDSADGLEEERRLMYVAITRARARLYLSCAQARMLHGRVRYNVRSRFLDELPDEALHWISARAAKSGAKSVEEKSQENMLENAGKALLPGSVVGQHVFHPKFGEGRVLAVQGQGEDAKVQVRFVRHGTKWLLLTKARLTLIEIGDNG